MTDDLMKAVLSMDAYNRYNNRGMAMASPFIGNYSFVDIALPANAASISFVAAAYLHEDGSAVISYRGTDQWGISEDVINGFPIGAGIPFGTQFFAAFEFYKSVLSEFESGANPNINLSAVSLTGHSLGGGLAGLVAAIYGSSATIFANMPFEQAADVAYQYMLRANDPLDPGEEGPYTDPILHALAGDARNLIYGGSGPWSPVIGTNIDGYAVTAEALSALRLLQSTPVDQLDPGTADLGSLTEVERHSMALHTLLMWEKENSAAVDGWQEISKDLWSTYTDDAIGSAAGFYQSADTTNTEGQSMASAIAYSVIDEGVRPYGDTAVKAMFGDAHDLGEAASQGSSDFLTGDVKTGLTKMLVHYAGLLANKMVLETDRPDGADGIFSLNTDSGALSVDLTDEKWTFGEATYVAFEKSQLLAEVATQVASESEIAAALAWYKETVASDLNSYDLIGSATFDLEGTVNAIPALDAPAGRLDLIAAISGADARSRGFSDDFLLGSSGAESFLGGAGSDVIFAGGSGDNLLGDDGADYLHGGGGNDVIVGGAGNDVVGFSGLRRHYSVKQASGGTFEISHRRGTTADGVDIVSEVERATFFDGSEDLLRFSCSSDRNSVKEGATVTFNVSAAKSDGSGPARDIWVYVKPEGSASLTDFHVLNAQPPGVSRTAAASSAMQASGGFWVKIPAGQTEVSVNVLAKSDGVTEDAESAKFTIVSYVQLVADGTGIPYLDAPLQYDFDVVNEAAPVVTISNSNTDVSLQQSGGYEGFSKTIDVAPNTMVDLWFDAQSIPDYLKIWDPLTGQIYANTSFTSGEVSYTFTTGAAASGRLQIAVMTNDIDTAWDLSIESNSGVAAAAHGAALQLHLLDASAVAFVSSVELVVGGAIITADTIWTDIQEVSPASGDVTKVYLTRRNDLSQEVSLGWRIEPADENAVEGADFSGGLPQGLITFEVGQVAAQFNFSAALDALDEAPEGYRIVFFNPSTGLLVSGVDGGPAELTGQIVPPPAGLMVGTAGNDNIVAGTTDSTIFGNAGDDVLSGGAGNDSIDGGAGDDSLRGGGGLDRLTGGNGSDSYQFANLPAGFNTVVVEDYGTVSDFDVLELGDLGNIAPVFSLEGRDVLITNPLTLQTIRLAGQLDGNGVEQVSYLSRGYWHYLDRNQLAQTSGSLSYNLGDGDLDLNATTMNSGVRLTFGTGLSNSDLYFSRTADAPDDLLISVSDGSTIEIRGLFSPSAEAGFTGVTMPDGTFLAVSELQQRAIVFGTSDDENVALGSGNDHVDAGAGDDVVDGGTGSDAYEYALGDGHDTIIDTRDASDRNVLRLHDITPNQVSAVRIDNDIWLQFGSGGSILLERQLGGELPHRNELGLAAGGVTSIEFDDGTIWDAEAIKDAAGYVAPRTAPPGTAANDVLVGDYWDDDILGLAGNDQIDGGAGDDVLIGGEGDDQLTGREGNDQLLGSDGEDVLTGNEGADDLQGGGGSDMLDGGDGADSLYGQGGADEVYGGAGADLVVAGDGDVTNDLLDGEAGHDTLDYSGAGSGVIFDLTAETAFSATEGNDTFFGFERLIGSTHADVFTLGGTISHIEGGGGNDSYVIPAAGQGEVRIIDSATEVNDLLLQELTPSDVIFSFVPERPGDEWQQGESAYLKIEVPTSGAIITVPSETLSFDGEGNKLFGIGRIVFADGTVWTAAQISQAAWIRDGSATGQLSGTIGSDTFYAGEGQDLIDVGRGGDRVLYSEGDGNDIIYSSDGDNDNTSLEFLDINFSDIELVRQDIALYVNILTTGQRVQVQNHFIHPGVAFIKFQDGQIIDKNFIEANVFIPPIIGTAGADSLYGTASPEVLDGGLGNDTYSGSFGNDTYVYRRGDGSDLIYDYGGDNGDTLKLADLVADDLAFAVSGQDVSIKIIESGEVVTLKGFNTAPGSIDLIQFSDGTTIDRAGIAELIGRIRGTSADDVLVGTSGADTFYGLDGNDTMSSFQGNDTYIGGAGDDLITSYFGADTYIWAKGDGNDTINDFVVNGGVPEDVLRLIDVAFSDVALAQAGNDLILTIISTGEYITIGRQFTDQTGGNGIEGLEFEDGTVWDSAELRQRANVDPTIRGSSGDDSISLPSDYQRVDASTGNDYLTVSGNGGGTIIFRAGDGHDTLDNPGSGYQRNDRLELEGLNSEDITLSRNGDQLKIAVRASGDTFNVLWQYWQNSQDYGLSSLQFADGTVWDRAKIHQEAWITGNDSDNEIYGSDQAETFAGNGGNDYLAGAYGSDVYRYASGDGADRIRDIGDVSDVDVLRMTDLDADNLSLRREGSTLFVKTISTGQEIRIDDQFYFDGTYGIEQLVFADGVIWDRNRIQQEAWFRGTNLGDEIYGSELAETLVGNGGNDYLAGAYGSDVYRYASGDGADRIQDIGDVGDVDVLRITGLNAGELSLRREGATLFVKAVATDQEIRVDDQFHSDAAYGIEQLVFANGEIWDRERIQQEAWIRGSNVANEIYGSELAETLVGNGGNDYLAGGYGSDVYRYALNDGADRIQDVGDVGDVDVLRMTDFNADNVSLRRDGSHLFVKTVSTGQEIRIDDQFYSDATYGIEQLIFSNGSSWDRERIQQEAWIRGSNVANEIYGSDLAETLVGNGGDDYLAGGYGSDVYRYALNDGADRIQDVGDVGDVDVLRLTDFNADEVSLRRDGSHLFVKTVSTGQEIRVDNQFYSNATYGIEQIVFADGAFWNRDRIQQEAWLLGDDNNNELYGSDQADTLVGNGGNDYLAGGGGGDVYHYASTDGVDQIYDSGTIGDVDVLLLTDLNPADISLQQGGVLTSTLESDLWISIIPTGKQMQIHSQFIGNESGLEQIIFADGTIWDRVRIRQETPWNTNPPGAMRVNNGSYTMDDGADQVSSSYAGEYDWQGTARRGNARRYKQSGHSHLKSIDHGQIVEGSTARNHAFLVNFTAHGLEKRAFDAPSHQVSLALQRAHLSASQLIQAASSFAPMVASFDDHLPYRERANVADHLHANTSPL